MSFVDISKLALHRRSEMEDRINVLLRRCEQAQGHIQDIKVQAQSFIEQLNCAEREPRELRERFLNCMMQLDEYIYLVTDFNLSFENQETGSHSQKSHAERVPVQDSPSQLMPVMQPHLLDVLSDPVPSTSSCPPTQVTEKKKKKTKKEMKPEELIQFSSASCSIESVPDMKATLDKGVQCETPCEPPVEELNRLELDDEFVGPAHKCDLPKQAELPLEPVHQGCVMHVDGAELWAIIGKDNIDNTLSLILEMNAFYSSPRGAMSRPELLEAAYCACRDEDTAAHYRAMFLQIPEGHDDIAQVFLVDTGEIRFAQIDALKPLARRFCKQPPYARLCHLAGIDMLDGEGEDALIKHENFLKKYVGQYCDIIVDDNSSESLGVYISFPNKELLNQLVVNEGLAIPVSVSGERPGALSAAPSFSNSFHVSSTDIAGADDPEYDDPVEAVTGYKNRDEIDICKHYKGGSEKKCFKGSRCKKRHVAKHPDGWSMDRESVARARRGALPAPGDTPRARVTCVEHLDKVWVHFIRDPKQEPKHGFGESPMTLEALERDMNSPASRAVLKPLKLAPSPGELVAALYPPDGCHYRALVHSHDVYNRHVEVQYVDYGTKMMVKEKDICELDRSYTVLPMQAYFCRLAGVTARSEMLEKWAEAKKMLEQLVLGKDVKALIVERGYDELVVKLLDEEDRDYCEKLAERGLVNLREVAVVDDSHLERVAVVP